MVHRQLQCAAGLMQYSLVRDPLVESLIHGLLLVADHPYRHALAAPAETGRPVAVRDAMDIIEAGPHLPLTTSTLAKQSHVSVRTLQDGFRRHLGMSPMAYVRMIRLRRAHRDLRSADPAHSTVAAVAHRWGSPTSADSPPRTSRCLAKHRCKPCALHGEIAKPQTLSLYCHRSYTCRGAGPRGPTSVGLQTRLPSSDNETRSETWDLVAGSRLWQAADDRHGLAILVRASS
jgi:AraC-like DNA-binding protein